MVTTKEDSILEKLLGELASLKSAKGAEGTPTTHWDHGPGGIFSTAGLDKIVFSTRVKPQSLLSVLPVRPTNFMSPLFPYLTGFLADTGSNPNTVCDNCMTAGLKKACVQTAQFGRYCRQTQELSFERIGELINRGEPTDLALFNPVFDAWGPVPQVTNQNPLKDEVAQKMLELGVSVQNLLAVQLWNGNPANNNVGGGYMEFPGLAILVGTGKVDALTNTACPSLDSDVKNYSYQDVCTGSPSIVEVLTYLYRYVHKNGVTMQMEPVDLRFAMREELFYELTSCWPCSYLSFRCQTRDTALIDVVPALNAEAAIRMRDEMRNGRYLLIDGKQIPVILDDGIDEESNTTNANLQAGEFSSDIYLLPFSAKGVPMLYLEYYDFRVSEQGLRSGPGNMFQDDYFVSDGGMFSWNKSKVNRCFLWDALIRPRVILHTPHLAGRLQNVKYVPLQHTREPFPADGYFVDGGVTSRAVATYYSEWHRQ